MPSMAHGWEGEKVRLVPLDKEKHLQNALAWLNDPEVTRWLLMGDFPLAQLEEEQFFEKMTGKNREHAMFAIETLNAEHIGFTGIHAIDWRQGIAGTGTVIGRKDLWGKGYGTDAARIRTRYAFDVLGLRLLRSEAFAENDVSISMLKKAGYVEAGRIPKLYWKRGEYRDILVFYCDRESWGAASAAT